MSDEVVKLSPLQMFAQARRIVGVNALTIRYGERPDVVTIDPERVIVVLSRELFADIPGGVKVTHRGLRWLTFNLNKSTGRWIEAEPVIVMNKLTTPEIHVSYGAKSAEDQVEQRAFEDMCYRPGTPACPMDNLPRQRQGFPPPRRGQ
ncbi:hypothetical protein AB0F25_30340 [Streptomyces wedmorensis]|uniref:hypothetical protein n=1 Tax=Streptomyces wedmorensis TaxID=43759 RepID=UPI0034491264